MVDPAGVEPAEIPVQGERITNNALSPKMVDVTCPYAAIYLVFPHRRNWWLRRDSNPPNLACRASALPRRLRNRCSLGNQTHNTDSVSICRFPQMGALVFPLSLSNITVMNRGLKHGFEMDAAYGIEPRK